MGLGYVGFEFVLETAQGGDYGGDNNSGYEAFLPRATNADRPLQARIVGKHCESGDVLVDKAHLPHQTHPTHHSVFGEESFVAATVEDRARIIAHATVYCHIGTNTGELFDVADTI